MADKQIVNMQSFPANVKAFTQQVAAWEEKYGVADKGNTGEAEG